MNGHVEVVKELLANGARIEAENKDHATSLFVGRIINYSLN